MTRLIDADALNEKLCNTTIFIKSGEIFQRMINDAPTIEPDGDTISRSQAIKDVSEWATDILHPDRLVKEDAIHILESLPSAKQVTGKLNNPDDSLLTGGSDTCKESGSKLESAEAVQGWIPIKYHEITEIERKENGYPKDWVYFLDCEMPQDGQEILVQAKNGEIRWDVCYEDDGFSLDSGWDWKDDIIAWMPLPDPYKGGDDNGKD